MYSDHEKEKKRLYNSRVIEVSHGTFTPLVFSTSGGMSRECTFFEKAEQKTESEIQSEILRYNQLCKKKTTCGAFEDVSHCNQRSQGRFFERPINMDELDINLEADRRE